MTAEQASRPRSRNLGDMLEVGSVLQGRYRIEGVLGTGGMGAVYLATEALLGGKKVAIKEMAINVSEATARHHAVEQFQKEASILATLDHPGLVDVTHYFEEQDKQYLVMAFVDGVTLERVVQDTPKLLPVPRVLQWMDEVADVLEYLHGHTPPIIFRDLKPSNVMLDRRNRIRLIDFGIARSLSLDQKTAAFLKGAGTQGFAPLEQLGRSGTTDPRTDMYSLGATMYSLLTRTIPPSAVDLATQDQVLVPPSRINPAIPAALEAVILRMMALNKDNRYASVAQAREALRIARPAGEATPVVLMTRPQEPTTPPPGLADGAKTTRLQVGDVLQGRYVILQDLASGGMGTVYLGQLITLHSKKVAIKVLQGHFTTTEQQERAMEHFQEEAGLIASLDHPNLVHVNDFFSIDGTAYIVMDYIEGPTMQQMLNRQPGFLPPQTVLDLVHQLCDVLDYLHNRKPPIIFRDLKPANIMVNSDGRVRLIDFGIARALHTEDLNDSFLRGTGTHGFAPIEQYLPDGLTDATSDVYALGATLYALCTRQVPPAAVEMVAGVATLTPPDAINPALPAELGRVIVRMMQSDKALRLQSMAEVRTAVDRAFLPPDTPRKAALPRSDGQGSGLAVRSGRACPRCRSDNPVRAAACGVCGAKLERTTTALPTDRTRTATLDKLSGPDSGVMKGPTAPKIQAFLVITGLLDLLRSSGHLEPVKLIDIDPDRVIFETKRDYRPTSSVQMRLVVPPHAEGAAQQIDTAVVIQERTAGATLLWKYTAEFKSLAPRLRPLLTRTHERRRTPRFKESFALVSEHLKGHRAVAVDVSPGGIGLLADGEVPVGSDMLLTLHLDTADGPPARPVVRTRVIHCTRYVSGQYRIGASFENLSEASARALVTYMRRPRK